MVAGKWAIHVLRISSDRMCCKKRQVNAGINGVIRTGMNRLMAQDVDEKTGCQEPMERS